INHEEIASKLLRSLKSKEDAVIESVKGYQMTDAQKYRMRLVRAHMDYITAEIGTDMSQFSSSKRLCCWAGLTPGSNESAGKKKSVRITRAGVYLKPALVQCAHAAVKSDKSPYYKKKYDSLVKRRGKKRAIIAIARMILTAIYQMMSTGEQWNPSDLYKIDMPVALVEKQKAKAIKQAKKLLQREGLLPPDEPLAS
ncbi:transposase, partial [Enterocloster clostridioformis]